MTAQIIHHLWQSTLCVGAVWVLAVMLRRHRARLRYLIWLAASFKFLVPFSALMALGLAVRPSAWHGVSFIQARLLSSAASLVEPAFGASVSGAVLSGTNLRVLIVVGWGVGSAVVFASWLIRWLRWRATVAAAPAYYLNVPIDVRISSAVEAPCVFGVFEPVLLLPEKTVARLSDVELAAVCAHELCHVRRCDNLMAAIHMLVAAIFWFYPPVWWIGRRLLEERERACDEHVVESGTRPDLYAQSILKVSRISVESRRALVASAAGANLRERIAAIVENRPAKQLGRLGSACLIVVACAVLVLPVSLGIAASRDLASRPLPTGPIHFDRVTIALSRADPKAEPSLILRGGRLSMRNTSLRRLVEIAFDTTMIIGGPVWLNACYDIEARSASHLQEDTAVSATQRQMILGLLVERFDLRFVDHRPRGI